LRGLPFQVAFTTVFRPAVFVLNGSAERLWDFLSSPQSAGSMARHLTDEYGIAMNAAQVDVMAFLKDLELNGLIIPETNQ